MRNKAFYAGLLLLATTLTTSCTEDKDWSGGLKQSDLVFQTYMPTEGSKGTELSIRGNNFGDDPAQVQVWVNDKEATLLSVANTRINAKVADASGSGAVKVRVGETTYSYPNLFTYGFVRNVYTLAGTGQETSVDGNLLESSFQWPIILAYDKWDDALFILQDEGRHRIRRLKNGKVETICETAGIMNNARSICFSITGDTLFIGNDNGNNPTANPVAVAMATRQGGFTDLKSFIASDKLPRPHINGIAVNPADGSLFTYHWHRFVFRYDKATETCEEMLNKDQFNELVLGFFPDEGGNNVNIGGDGGYASLNFSPDGKTLYWVGRDPYQGLLKADYDPATRTCKNLARFAGNGVWGNADGQGTAARMDQPNQAAVDKDGNLYVTTRYGHTVRKVTPQGYVTTYAGMGWNAGYADGQASQAKFDQPYGIAVDNEGNVLVSEGINRRIRIIKEE